MTTFARIGVIMKFLQLTISIIIVLFFMEEHLIAQNDDWPNIAQYKEENIRLGLPLLNEDRIVFLGNSITESWSKIPEGLFKDKRYINRGISGQTTPQMLIRFRPDVINLKPKVVVLLAGTNDIAENTGPPHLK